MAVDVAHPSALAEALGVPAEQLTRALHSTNLLLGLPLPDEQRHALLRGLYAHAGQPLPPDDLIGPLLAHGPLAASLDELRDVPGLEDDDALRTLVLALGDPTLGEAMGQLLQQLTGVAAAVPDLPPAPDPADLLPELPADLADDIDPGTLRWDVLVCSYDVATRRHQLTLLRAGVSVAGPVCTDADERTAGDPAAEWLFEDALSAPLLSSAADHLLRYAQAFQTPPLPDLDAWVAQLQAAHGPFQQLYLLAFQHSLPAPSRVTQTFWLREAGERGQEQRLSRDLSISAAGLSLESAATTLQSRWDTPARLCVPGTERPYRPPPLSSDDLRALPMGGGWQARLSWSLELRPLLPDGPRLPVAVEADLQGRVAVSGRGRLQEHVAASSGMFAAIYDATAGVWLRCSGDPALAPESGIDWTGGVSSGAGTLSVHVDDADRDLSAAGVQLTAEQRPSPGLPPNIAEDLRWADADPIAPLGDAVHLRGGVVLEQTARLEDSLQAAQATVQVSSAGELETVLRASVGGYHLQLDLAADAGAPTDAELPDAELDPAGVEVQTRLREHPWGGVIRIDGVPRWRLCWRSRIEQAEVRWSTGVELVSGGTPGWGETPEALRDPVTAHSAVAVERVAGGYVLLPITAGEVVPASVSAAGRATRGGASADEE